MKQTNIAVSKLRPFENNPYQVRDDAEMNTLIKHTDTRYSFAADCPIDRKYRGI